jgi:hypothetical protein
MQKWVGASAGVMAIGLATTLLTPNYRFFPMINGGIPLWVITIIFVIIDFAMIAKDFKRGRSYFTYRGRLFGLLFMWQIAEGSRLECGD